MIIGGKRFEGRTYVMAIINITPDSFWKDSRSTSRGALAAAERAAEEGADILDIGAQSTRPGYEEVGEEEEISRLGGVLGGILRLGLPVSVDTYHARVAEFALSEGAHMINDVWGLSRGNGMEKVIASHGASVCIMHNSPSPVTGDVFPPVEEFLKRQAAFAVGAGISPERICLDGGIGFAKSREQNIALLNDYARLKSVGYPLLLGCSRKSLFGGEPGERLPQTLAATRAAAQNGILFVRVHDVKQNKEEIQKIYEN